VTSPTAGADRGQANLLAIGLAVLALTAALGLGVFLAEGALDGERRAAGERATAVAVSQRLVAADGPFGERRTVLNASRLAGTDAAELIARYPGLADADFRVTVGDRVVAERGDPTDGTTIRRIVTVRETAPRTLTPALSTDDGPGVTLPRRTDRVRLRIEPPANATVRTVRVDGRVVLHDPSGLNGTHEVSVSWLETLDISVEGEGSLPAGSVAVTYFPATDRKAELEVTVDA
jgi:hypothetical protein